MIFIELSSGLLSHSALIHLLLMPSSMPLPSLALTIPMFSWSTSLVQLSLRPNKTPLPWLTLCQSILPMLAKQYCLPIKQNLFFLNFTTSFDCATSFSPLETSNLIDFLPFDHPCIEMPYNLQITLGNSLPEQVCLSSLLFFTMFLNPYLLSQDFDNLSQYFSA